MLVGPVLCRGIWPCRARSSSRPQTVLPVSCSCTPATSCGSCGPWRSWSHWWEGGGRPPSLSRSRVLLGCWWGRRSSLSRRARARLRTWCASRRPRRATASRAAPRFFAVVFLGMVGYLVWRAQPRRPVATATLGILLLLLSSSGLSRVYVGAHWATNVLGGWLLGGAWLLVLVAAHRWWSSKRIMDSKAGDATRRRRPAPR